MFGLTRGVPVNLAERRAVLRAQEPVVAALEGNRIRRESQLKKGIVTTPPPNATGCRIYREDVRDLVSRTGSARGFSQIWGKGQVYLGLRVHPELIRNVPLVLFWNRRGGLRSPPQTTILLGLARDSLSLSTDSPCECEHNNPDSLDARVFFTVVLAVAPAVTMDEASSLSWYPWLEFVVYV